MSIYKLYPERVDLMKKRILIAALAAVMLLSGCSFENIVSDDLLLTVQNREPVQNTGYEYTDVTALSIPIGEDEMNPYDMSIDTNLQLVPLVYDGLVRLRPDYGYDLALAAEVNNRGTVCDVTLKNGIVFSDGSPVTAYDVQYSYRQAVYWGKTEYSDCFDNVGGVSVLDDETVRFYLYRSDEMFPNNLTFPVLKTGTAQSPVGCGRFYLAKDRVLKPNRLWYGGDIGKIDKITLVDQPDRETSFYSMKIGSLDYLFVDADEEITDGGGSVHYVEMPNLIYLGINDTRGRLSDSRFRRLLEAAIDREKILGEVYFDRATPTDLPFPAGWEKLSGREGNMGGDYSLVQVLLSDLGLDKRDEEGYIIVGSRRVSLDILVNGDNPTKVKLAEALAKTLCDIGFDVSVRAETFADYQALLSAGDFDLYLGEVRLRDDLDLDVLLRELNFPTTEENLLVADYFDEWQGKRIELDSFILQFESAMPLIPLGTRNGIVYYNRDIYYELRAAFSDIFYNIQNW